ncbi:MAG: NUDIX hydrolase, partial [Candidatus Caldarchaeum sp.]
MFKTIKSEVLFKGREFSVRRDLVESGGKQFYKDVVIHPGAVVIIPLEKDNSIYLIRQYRHAVGAELVELPAGTLEDESPEACASRELVEETGFEAESFERLAEFYLAPGYSTELMHVYVAKGLRRSKPSPAVDEQITLIKTSVKNAVEMILRGEIRDAKTIASLTI